MVLQLNPVVGDIRGNLARLKKEIRDCPKNISLMISSELYLTGYPPKDLLLYPGFIQEIQHAIQDLLVFLKDYPGLSLILGTPFYEESRLYNAAILIQDAQIQKRYFKQLLPNHDVFDEK